MKVDKKYDIIHNVLVSLSNLIGGDPDRIESVTLDILKHINEGKQYDKSLITELSRTEDKLNSSK